jgi:indolepyruvate ferredoxin oxidoreductase beta subunit
VNVAMVGAVSGYLPISKNILIESIKALFSQKTIEVNLRAFEMGRGKVEEC